MVVLQVDTIYVLSTGIEDPSGVLNNLKVYPNPTDGLIYIELNLPDYTNIRLEFYDETGRKIYIREFSNVNSIHESMDMSVVKPGLYFLKMSTEKAQVVKNIVVL